MKNRYFQINETFTRKIWRRLRSNQVPIVSEKRYKDLPKVVEATNKALISKEYMPSIGHGYLGQSKGQGVTRFLPILSDVDMAVYYHICFTLSDVILKQNERVFGGWHLVPKNQQKGNIGDQTEFSEKEARGFLQSYYSDPFSSTLWLKEWRSFTDLIQELCAQSGIGNYVIQTDVANFYDSIEITRLIRNLRRDANKYEEYIETLELFLSYWNRRINGYQASTKGIPQEIISDASRILSHYYLQDFDDDLCEYCEGNDLVNIRWADDILIFGKSKSSLELAVHKASKILLSSGLNLNASKTKIFTRSAFAKYRALDVLSAISANDHKAFQRNLKKAVKYNISNDMRIDTVFRASIGYVNKLGSKAEIYEKNFVLETASNSTDLLLSLNARQMLNVIRLADNSLDYFKYVLRKVIASPYAAPRATFLQMLRKHHVEIITLGISKKVQISSANIIDKQSEDSAIIQEFCVPTIP